MVNVLTLQKLQAFARKNRRTLFDLTDDRKCPACQAAGPGSVMSGWTYFQHGPYSQVDVYFAALCRELHHRGVTTATGDDLDRMLGGLIAGTHPRQVADEHTDRQEPPADPTR